MNRELIREVRRWHRFAQEDIEEAERQMQAVETVPRHPARRATDGRMKETGDEVNALSSMVREHLKTVEVWS